MIEFSLKYRIQAQIKGKVAPERPNKRNPNVLASLTKTRKISPQMKGIQIVLNNKCEYIIEKIR